MTQYLFVLPFGVSKQSSEIYTAFYTLERKYGPEILNALFRVTWLIVIGDQATIYLEKTGFL